ncbi:hypothetical protein ACOMHN_029498 [Nucella lapillus]
MGGRTCLTKLANMIPSPFLKSCFRAKCTPVVILFIVGTGLAFSYASQYRPQPQPASLKDPDPIVSNPHTPKKEVAPVSTSGSSVVTSHPSPVFVKQQCSSDRSLTNIVFIKVHKAGSSTVSNLLARYALIHDLNIALPEQKPVGSVFHCFGPFFEYRVLPLAQNQPYHVLFNHMFYNRSALNNVMPKKTFYVAIMREPVKRFLSGIYYFGNLKPPARNNTDNAAFKRFINEPNKLKVEKNFRVFNSVAWNTGLPLKEQKKEDSVREHVERLGQELDLMMVMEHFLESLVLFKRMACLSLRDIVFMKINSRKTYNVHSITKEDMNQLKSWQMADHVAYEYFYSKFWELVKKQGDDFNKEVGFFRVVTEKVGKYCAGNRPKFDVLVIHRSRWNNEFSLSEKDCQLMKSDERELQKLLLTRARDRRDRAGWRETRKNVPKWNSDC